MKIDERISRLEARLSAEKPSYVWIVPIGRTPAGWECMQTSIRTIREPGESDDDLEARAIAADVEALKKGIGAGMKVRVFHSHGIGWSY